MGTSMANDRPERRKWLRTVGQVSPAETRARGIRLVFIMQWGGAQMLTRDTRVKYAADVLDCAARAHIRTVDTWDALKAAWADLASDDAR